MKKNVQQKSNRSRLITIIHAQKSSAGLDDATYRTIIYGATGKSSCTECSYKELNAVFYDLNTVLLKRGKEPFKFFAHYEKPSLLDAVIARAKKILGEDWQNRIDQFLTAKVRKTTLNCLNQKELRQVMGFISTVERNTSR